MMNTHTNESMMELGDVHDNVTVLLCALRVSRGDPHQSVQMLRALRDHIEVTQEASSVEFILPKVLRTIAFLTEHEEGLGVS